MQALIGPLRLSRHSKVTPVSMLENLAVALGETVVPPGSPLTVATGGAVVSTRHEEVLTELTFPASSVALTETECVPSTKPVSERGEVQVL